VLLLSTAVLLLSTAVFVYSESKLKKKTQQKINKSVLTASKQKEILKMLAQSQSVNEVQREISGVRI